MARMALCIGINNYPGFNSDLRGCVNDARDWANALKAYGFTTTTLIDTAATRAAMVAGFERVVAATQSPGDLGVIQYSGHGTWVPDQNGDEIDGRDEAFCPADITDDPASLLLDDDVRRILSGVPSQAMVVLITDCCHSGSLTRNLSLPGMGSHPRFISPTAFGNGLSAGQLEKAVRKKVGRRVLDSVLHVAGCQDTEYSYDAEFNKRPNGALTYFALQELKKGLTYRDWMTRIKKHLPSSSYPQHPKLNGSTRLTARKVFA